jgi:hypothetical protein
VRLPNAPTGRDKSYDLFISAPAQTLSMITQMLAQRQGYLDVKLTNWCFLLSFFGRRKKSNVAFDAIVSYKAHEHMAFICVSLYVRTKCLHSVKTFLLLNTQYVRENIAYHA